MLYDRYHVNPASGQIVRCRGKVGCESYKHYTKSEYIDYHNSQPNRMFIKDIFFARRHPADPFHLNVVYSPLDNSFDGTRSTYSNWDRLRYKNTPRSYTDLDGTYEFFLKLKKWQQLIIVPDYTYVRSTNPKYNSSNGAFISKKRKKIQAINVCSGSVGISYSRDSLSEADVFHPVSVTWVGLDGYFYNVYADDRLIKANSTA